MPQGGTPCRRARRAVRPESPTSPEGLVCVGGGAPGGPPDTTNTVAPKAPNKHSKRYLLSESLLSAGIVRGKLTELNIQSELTYISDRCFWLREAEGKAVVLDVRSCRVGSSL
ncbi:putative 11.9 kDa protein [Beak and feather disease virus]|uniref:Putative 11.9 kDa protein n=1 Tax=Beak and feather disease virus TaxID=77856 RepID=C6JSW1_BFDV|nr:putative 11.9 kDa protein [Beak and feather disease virus]